MGFTTILLLWFADTAAALVAQPVGSGSGSADLRGEAKARRKADALLKAVEAEVETEVAARGSESDDELSDRVTAAALAEVSRFVDRELAREFGPEAVERPGAASEGGRETEEALLDKANVIAGKVASEAERHREHYHPAGDEEHKAMVSQIIGRIADEARDSDKELKLESQRAATDSADKQQDAARDSTAEEVETTDEEELLIHKKEVDSEGLTDAQDLRDRQELREQTRADQLLETIEAELEGELGGVGDTSDEAVVRLKNNAFRRITARLENDIAGDFGRGAANIIFDAVALKDHLRRAHASSKKTDEILTRAEGYADRYARAALKLEARKHEARPVMEDEERNDAVKDVLNSVAEAMSELGMHMDELKVGDSTSDD